MPGWISQLRGKIRARPSADESAPDRTLELLVVEGPDAGSQYTVDGEIVHIGRGIAHQARTGEVCLRDPSVSSEQALIHVSGGDAVLEHRAGARNETRLNGRAIQRSAIRVGDRIQVGSTVLEVRSRPGIALTGLLSIARTALDNVTTELTSERTTRIRPPAQPRAELVLLRGIPDLEGHRFPLLEGRSRIGRHRSNEVVLPDLAVSRFHAELAWENDQLFLAHTSATNSSEVDGRRVAGRVPLRSGQVIRLADSVELRVELLAPDATSSTARDAARVASQPRPSLKERMEEKLRRDAEIERDYGFSGSFLDIDVVDSHGLKVQASRPEHIIVSFERFRAFARSVVEEHRGQVLNSNGDELMCFFDEPAQAVHAAAALIDRISAFNEAENLLGRPFRVRQGIHTGRSLIDRERGVAYSPVLDVAGHLQKFAPENGLLVSDETLAQLPDRTRFSAVGELGKEKISAYSLGASK